MNEAPDSAKPNRMSNVFASVVIVLICLYADVWLWSMSSKALSAHSNILPLIGMIGYAASILIWIPITRWMIRRHSK